MTASEPAAIVDAHTHYAPRFLLRELAVRERNPGLHLDRDVLVTPGGLRLPVGYPELIDPAAKLESLDERGIEAALVSLTPHLFLYESTDPVGYAQRANDDLAAYVSESARLSGLATLPIVRAKACAQELERAVGTLGLAGAQIGTSLPDGCPLDLAGLDPLFEVAEALDVPLVLHPYYVGPLQDPSFFLNNSVGVPFDTCLAAARLIVSGTLDRWRRLRLLLVHGGGYLPFQIGRLDNAWSQRSELREHAAAAPSSYLRRFWYDSVVHSSAALSFLASLVGPDRIVMGTDAPYLTGEQHPVEAVKAAGLDPVALAVNTGALVGDRSGVGTRHSNATRSGVDES